MSIRFGSSPEETWQAGERVVGHDRQSVTRHNELYVIECDSVPPAGSQSLEVTRECGRHCQVWKLDYRMWDEMDGTIEYV